MYKFYIWLQLLEDSTKLSVNLDISFGPEEIQAENSLRAINETAEKAKKMVVDVANQVSP